jgi:DNA primase
MSQSLENNDAVQRVKDAAQIVDVIGECVSLKRAGTNMKGLCPFHGEKTPSFMVNPERQTFHCFGCGEGGDVLSFVIKYYNLTFPEALKELANRYHITLPEKKFTAADKNKAEKRQKLFEVNERATRMYHEFLVNHSEAAQARSYLAGRDISPEMIVKFKLGYAPPGWDYLNNKVANSAIPLTDAQEAGLLVKKEKGGCYDRFRDRVMFPIFELTGRVVGFGGRILGEGEPKYLNTPETLVFDKSRMLFGLYQHRDIIRQTRQAVIVEGNFDLLSLAAHGMENVVAPLGTALTQIQIRMLKGYADEIILLFDGDAAGVKAAMRSVPLFLAEQAEAKVALLPTAHDPDSYIRAHGKEGLEKYLAEALPLLEFAFENLQQKHGLSMTGKGKILEELGPFIEASASSPLQQSVIISQFSEKLGLDPEQMLKGFRTAAKPRRDHRPIGSRTVPVDKKAEKTAAQMDRKQAHLIEFLVFYPQFLGRFLEAGIEEIMGDGFGGSILAGLQKTVKNNQAAGPEQLMETLEPGPERSYVSKLLISSPFLKQDEEDEMAEKMAEEMLVWLVRYRFKKEIEQISRDIRDAQQAQDNDLLEELVIRKAELNKYIGSMDGGHDQ